MHEPSGVSSEVKENETDSSQETLTRPKDKEMPFTSHLAELRNRIFYGVGAWVVCGIATWFITPKLIAWMRLPLGDTKLIFTKPTEAFMVYLKVAVIGGFFFAMPVILYQVSAFVSPGLEDNEKRWIKRMVPASLLLFIGGSAFGYFCVLPVTMNFFLTFQTQDVVAMISISEYIGFVSMMILVCGLIFQTPIVILLLAIVGLVNAPMLRKSRRWAILIVFIIAGIVTPTPDAFTQTVVAVPMIVLYELSILLVAAVKKTAPEPQL